MMELSATTLNCRRLWRWVVRSSFVISILVLPSCADHGSTLSTRPRSRPSSSPTSPAAGQKLFEFVGQVNGATGALTIKPADVCAARSASDGGDRSDDYDDWFGYRCQSIVPVNLVQDGAPGAGPANSVEMVTEFSGLDAIGCGAANRFCADVRLRSFYNEREILNPYVFIGTIVPATNHMPVNADAPAFGLSNQYGLWSYGTSSFLAAKGLSGDNFIKRWSFEHSDSLGWLFKGYVMGEINEFSPNATWTNWQDYPAASSFSDGRFVIVWSSYEQDGSMHGIFGQRYSATGEKAGTEFQVNTYTTLWQFSPDVATFNDGRFIVTWNSAEQDGSGHGVFGQRYLSSGARDGAEFQINTYTTNHQGADGSINNKGARPEVGVFADNHFVVVWGSNEQDGSGWGAYGQLFSSGGAKSGTEIRLSTYTTDHQLTPVVSVLSDQRFVALWSSFGQDGSWEGIYGQLFSSGGGKLGAEFRINTYTTFSQMFPAVDAFSDGRFVVTWGSYEQDGSGFGAFGQVFFSNGTKSGGELRLNTYTTNDQVLNYGYYNYHAFPAAVGVLSDGRFVVTWASREQDGSEWGIYGQRFAADGAVDGEEFRISVYTTQRQFSPAVTTFSDGRYLIVWASREQDGSLDGIYGQIYFADGTK